MKELNAQEMYAVSGAGHYGDLGAKIGGTIGKIIDARHGGVSKIGSIAGSAIGKGIGLIVDKIVDEKHTTQPDPTPTPPAVSSQF